MIAGWSSPEIRALRALRSPAGTERALDAMPYHLASTAWSPRRVLAARTAHCLVAAWRERGLSIARCGSS